MTNSSSHNPIGVLFIPGAGLGPQIWDGIVKKAAYPYKAVDFTTLRQAHPAATLEDYVAAALEQASSLKPN
jgi:hypothetical protein